MQPDFSLARVLAEILRLQRWAGGESIPADRIYGLMHGFESMMRLESEGFGISEEQQEKVEDLLDDVEGGRQSTDGPALKDRLRRDGIDEIVAGRVMRLCLLQSRFLEGIEQIVQGSGSVFQQLRHDRPPELDWYGALHYMELVDTTEEAHRKLHAVFAPTVPRVGEFVTPENGSAMCVVGVDYVMVTQGELPRAKQRYLVPHVLLKAVE